MSEELNHHLNDNTNFPYYGDLGYAAEHDNLFNGDMDLDQSDWLTHGIMDAMNNSAAVNQELSNLSAAHVPNNESITIDPSLLTGTANYSLTDPNAPPTQAGLTNQTEDDTRTLPFGSALAAFSDLPSTSKEAFPDVGVTNSAPGLTLGLTATPSPPLRRVVPDMSGITQGSPIDTDIWMANMEQFDNTLTTLPGPSPSVPGFDEGDFPAFPETDFLNFDPFAPQALNHGNVDLQPITTQAGHSLNLAHAPQTPGFQGIAPIVDGMQAYAPPYANTGFAQDHFQQPLQQSGEYNFGSQMANFPFQPTFQPPTFQQRMFGQPTFSQPMFEQPAFQQSAFQQPTFQPPMLQHPAFQQTILQESGSQQPTFPQGLIAGARKIASVPKPAPARGAPLSRKAKRDRSGFKREHTRLSRQKTWVRVNEQRQGANKRGGKLNGYDPSVYYTKVDPPPNWTAAGHVFEYNDDGELSKNCYTAQQIDAYLRYHDAVFSSQGGRKLRIWIQKSPADCARRYANPDSAECKFKDCLLRQLGKRSTVWQGHLRVAFDESYDMYGKSKNSNITVDPFAVAGYAHLYCFERFLDLPDLVNYVTVKLDSRIIDTEPNGEYPCRLEPDSTVDKRHDAAIKYMEQTGQGKLIEFPAAYPVHANHNGAAKPHELTLNGVMQGAYIGGWSTPKRTTMEKRDGPATLIRTLGDLEKYCAAKWPEQWTALQNGGDPKKIKESPKYERGTKGYGTSGKKKRKRNYETESESESELTEMESEPELDDNSSEGEYPKGKSNATARSSMLLAKHHFKISDDEQERVSKRSKLKGKMRETGINESEEEMEDHIFVLAEPRRNARRTAGKKVCYTED